MCRGFIADAVRLLRTSVAHMLRPGFRHCQAHLLNSATARIATTAQGGITRLITSTTHRLMFQSKLVIPSSGSQASHLALKPLNSSASTSPQYVLHPDPARRLEPFQDAERAVDELLHRKLISTSAHESLLDILTFERERSQRAQVANSSSSTSMPLEPQTPPLVVKAAAMVASDVDSTHSVNGNGSVVPCAAVVSSSAVAEPLESTAAAFKDAIMLQGFNWESHKHMHRRDGPWYEVVRRHIPQLQEWRVTHVWLPPPSQSVAPQGYLPQQLYNLNSAYGNSHQLSQLCRELKAAGIQPIADIVINHRCADGQDPCGVWNHYHNDGLDHGNTPLNWDHTHIISCDKKFAGQGNPGTGEVFEGAPNLDHQNPEVRKGLTDWLNWLKNDVGFASFRFDFAKGYAPQFISEYISSSVGDRVLNIGELWTDLDWKGSTLQYDQSKARQQHVEWVQGTGRTSTAFDFVTKGVLQEAIKHDQYDRLADKERRAPGLLGVWPQRAVTFIDNHDTGSTQNHWPFPKDRLAAGYAYILTHPGIPCLFWDHLFSWGDAAATGQVRALLELRKRAGICSFSDLEILIARKDLYVARIDGKVVLQLGATADVSKLQLPGSDDSWVPVASGNCYSVWERKQ